MGIEIRFVARSPSHGRLADGYRAILCDAHLVTGTSDRYAEAATAQVLFSFAGGGETRLCIVAQGAALAGHAESSVVV